MHAANYLKIGYSVNELRENSKKPVGEWMPYTGQKLDPELVQGWEGNVGVICGMVSGGLFAVDTDSQEKSAEFHNRFRHVLETITVTRRGLHFWFRWGGDGPPPNVKGEGIDYKGENSYVVAPPSIVDGFQYEFLQGHGLVPPGQLPVFKPEWLQKQRKEVPAVEDEITNRIVRAREYLSKVEGAVSGQHGHNKTMYVAGKLIQFFRLSIDQALPLILEWNDKCDPPWRIRELVRKLEQAQLKLNGS